MSLKVECRLIFNKIYFFSNLCHSLAHPQYNFAEEQIKMINKPSKFSAVEMRCKDKRIFENHQKASSKC